MNIKRILSMLIAAAMVNAASIDAFAAGAVQSVHSTVNADDNQYLVANASQTDQTYANWQEA